jgi:hypothetical protein
MLAGHGAQGHQQDYGTLKRVLCSYEVAKSRAIWKNDSHNTYYMQICVLTQKQNNYGAHRNLRAFTGQIINRPLNDCQKVGKPRW